MPIPPGRIFYRNMYKYFYWVENYKYITSVCLLNMKSIKISDESYVSLVKLKANLTSKNGKIRTFDEAIQELLNFYKEETSE